jgi:hypothetical protein
MKVLILTAMLLSSSMVFAADKAPAPFQNSKIERKLDNGKVQEFDGNEYEIVKRHKPHKKVAAKPKPTPVEQGSSCKVLEPVVKEKIIVKTVEVLKIVEPKKNDISLLVGYGPVGLQQDNGAGVDAVNFKRDIVGGLQYQRLIQHDLRLQISVLTNKSLIGGIGLDF